MPDEPPVITTTLPSTLPRRRAVDEQVGIEVALPEVPQAPGVVLERRHRDLRALERALGLARVEAGRVGQQLERLRRQAQVAQQHAGETLDRRQVQHRAADRRRHHRQHARVQAHGHFRGMRRAAEDVEHFADALRLRVHQVEGVAVEALLVRDVVHRVHHEVHRHDVDAAALDAQHGHPLRQRLAQLLDQGEQVVGAVDLVDLAGLRMADHRTRAVDAVRHLLLLAHQPFGIVLGAEVRVRQALGLLEHVLAEHARRQPGGGDGAGVVEAAGLDRMRELQRMPGAFDVGDLLRLGVRGQVVDRRQVEEMLHLPRQRLDLRGAQSELGLGQIPVDHVDAFAVPAHARGDRVQPFFRALAHEHGDLAPALQQLVHQEASDEAGGASHEIGHFPRPEARAGDAGPKR